MGFIGKFTNWISNKAQGISNKLGNLYQSAKDTASNAWERTKGVAGKVWEGTKDISKATGKFIYDNSDAIAAGLGGLAAGVAAGYGVDPGTILGVREAVGGVANMLPEGKIKSALLSAAWKQKGSPEADTQKLNLSKMIPGGREYTASLLNRSGVGEFGHKSNATQIIVPEATPKTVFIEKRKRNKRKKK